MDDLNKYIKNIVAAIENNSGTPPKMVNRIANDAKKEGIELTETDKKNLENSLNEYKKAKTKAERDEKVSECVSLLASKPRKKNTVNNKSNAKKDQKGKEELIVDIDTDGIMYISNELYTAANNVKNVSVSVPSGIAAISAEASEIEDEISKMKTTTAKDFLNEKKALAEALSLSEDIDANTLEPKKLSFKEIYSLANQVKTKIAEAALAFFSQNKNCKIDKKKQIVTFKDPKTGDVYKYDIKHKKFSVNGGKKIPMEIYIPSGNKNYSQLNTLTYFVSSDDDYKDLTMNEKYNYKTSAILIKFLKNDIRDYNGIKPNAQGEYNVKPEQMNIAAQATKFINSVANTDRTKCKNIVAGDSKYGSYSLQLAAYRPEMYDTVYCINNAVIVTKNAKNPKGNGIAGIKAQFDSFELLKKLDGKELYFMTASGDDNTNHYYGWTETDNFESSYLYTGLKLLKEYCPNARVHMIYNDNNGKIANKAASLKNLEKGWKNYTYEPESLMDFARKAYTTHSQGNYWVNDVVEAAVTNRTA